MNSIEDLVKSVITQLDGPKMWGLKTNGKWVRPIVIDDGEFYYTITQEHAEDEFDKQYFDYSKDIESCVYVKTTIKI